MIVYAIFTAIVFMESLHTFTQWLKVEMTNLQYVHQSSHRYAIAHFHFNRLYCK